MNPKFDIFECEFCNKRYARQNTLDRHKCEPKKRWEEIDSKVTRAAFRCYEYWLQCRGYQTPTKLAFINSKHFTGLGKFVNFSSKMMIPDKFGYIKHMTKLQLLPNAWCLDCVYQDFIDSFDDLYTPMKQVELSIEAVSQCARIMQCELCEVWEYISMNEVILMLNCRKMTPWFLFHCDSFKVFLRKCPAEDRVRYQAYIGSENWESRFKANPDTVEKIKRLNVSLKI